MNLGHHSADLHIHSCLSPCGELEMSPVRIAERAKNVGLDLIAICDHNSVENAGAVLKACSRRNLSVIAGMEITTSEEIHIVGLFPDLHAALAAQRVVYENLPGKNDEEIFGLQVIANEDDEVEGFNPRLLIGATTLSLQEVIDLVHTNGGLALAAHFDRESFSLVSQLGFIPENLQLDGIESASTADCDDIVGKGGNSPTVICSSDAHRLEEIGSKRTTLYASEPTFVEVGMALKGVNGRRMDIERV